MVEDGESTRELKGYETPTAEEYASAEITGIHLGDYIFWDEERQTEFIQSEYGWKETAIEGTYKRYKSAECIMPGVHDFANYLKRGYGRASFHASGDVRAGIVTREEAFEQLVPLDSVVPKALEYFQEITGITRTEFLETLDKQRHPLLNGKRPEIKEIEGPSARPTLFIEDLRRWVNGVDN
jgi:hypothetical protein